ncbi:hypothetical protein [Lacipirellula parvula]|uniref:Uncharacterized protein n=1 Tax=Lacipirellula parvula TaxID=2650471 RepID=A0A5K7XBN7_9BACT|nr:hypothetical protein [Lacipirellula parvula]BBO34220.1 hypothetical protein PLANPX_3832 [Lacipirellula parvula]
MRKKRFRYVGEYREGMKLEVGDIYRDASGVGFVVTTDRIQPVAATPDESDTPKNGKDGVDGRDGKDGRDGSPGEVKAWNHRGEYKRQQYSEGDVCESAGSSFLCIAPTKSEPPSRAWKLLAAKGEDGAIYHTSSHHTRTETVIGGPEKITAICDSDTPKGAVLYVSSGGHVDLACANGRPQTRAIGIATAAASAGQPVEYITVGPVSCETWSLTPGIVHYLDPAIPGGITAVYPTTVGQFVVVLGVATTTTSLNLSIHYHLEQS